VACRNEILGFSKGPASNRAFSAAARGTAAVGRRSSSSKTPKSQNSPSTIARPRWFSQTCHLANSSQTSSAESQTSASVPPSQRPLTFYALFPETLPAGPPPSGPFEIDVRALRREFLRLQAAAHPDFHHHAASGASADQSAARRRAEATSAVINQAFKTLSNPLLRAQYLLREQHGVDLEGDEAGSQAAPDPELLMTALEAREVIEEAECESDLEDVKTANEERIRESEQALATAFAEGDVTAAKAEAVKLRYWVNIRETVNNWEKGKPVVLHH